MYVPNVRQHPFVILLLYTASRNKLVILKCKNPVVNKLPTVVPKCTN